MENFILDTNIFFNMEAGLNLGEKAIEVVKNLSEKAKKLKSKNKASFYMTPNIVSEFLSFFENDENNKIIEEFLSLIIIESPQMDKVDFSALIFEKIIDEVRKRSYRGLNIAEEEIRNAAKYFLGKKISTEKDFQIQIGEFIRKFRERYRKATREGFLDSVADFEIIILAKQKNGFLVSTDEGVINWGRIMGVKEMPPLVFSKHLEFLLHSHPEQDLTKN